jgi:hypothetical protein
MSATLTAAATVDLGPATGHGIALRFWDRMDAEWFADYGYVEISTAPPYQDWQVLLSRTGNDYEWKQQTVPLNAFSGQVRLRFRFASDGFFNYGGTGWMVDDITLSPDAPWAEVRDASLNPIPNPHVTALHVLDTGTARTLYAATRNFTGGFQGTVYALDTGIWAPKAALGVDYLSLDGSRPGDPNAYLLAGTDGSGVHAATGAGEFHPFCSATPPAGRFIDVSVDRMNPIGGPHAAATETGVFRLDTACAPAYRPFTAFAGRPLSVLADCSTPSQPELQRFLVGTDGTGLMRLDCADPTLPPVPIANEGQSGGGGYLSSKNISKLALSATNPPTLFAASASEGLYKSRFPVDGKDYFVRHFYDPVRRGSLPGTALALAPGYDDLGLAGAPGAQTVYLGTRGNGVLRSDDGGSSWSRLAASPQGEEIVDLAVTTLAGGGHQVFALTAGARVWRSDNAGQSWTEEAHLDAGNDSCRAYDLALSPAFGTDCAAFAATSSSLYKRTCGGGPAWVPVFTARPVLSVAIAPFFDNDYRDTDDPERLAVLAGTEGGGMYHSFAWGDAGTFAPVPLDNPAHASLLTADVPALVIHPASDLDPNRNDTLYHCFLARHRTADGNDGVWCMSFLTWGCPSCFWEPFSANGPLGDALVTDLAFHPDFNRLGTTPNPVLYAAHQSQKVFRGVQQASFEYLWTPSAGFFHTPPFVYAVAESPDLPGTVLAGTKGYGPMMSFDGGISYYPWTAVQKGGTVLHDAYAAAFTHSTGTYSRLLVSAGEPSLAPTTDYGIYYQDYTGPGTTTGWSRSSLCLSGCASPAAYSPDNFNDHTVLELRYIDLATDLLASDFTAGPLKSDPADPVVPGALGQYWQVDASGTVPASLSDISAQGPATRAGIDPRGLNTFIWGAQGTLSQGITRSNVPGAYRFNPNLTVAAWETASGSSACALPALTNWRAVLSVSPSTTLIGARDGAGVYRTDDADAATSAGICWRSSDLGMNPGDRDWDYTEYSKRITAFTRAANGLLAAMEEEPALRSGTGGAPGGVFFSDSASGGRAWVPVQVSVNCASNYELAGGSKYYTGTTCDGIYAATAIAYTGQPTAFFTAARSTDPWHEERVTFTDYSAGNPASRSWDFGDGSAPSSANPVSHEYEFAIGYAAYPPTLTATGQLGTTDTHQEAVEVVNTFITGIRKVGEQVLVAWAEVSGGGHTYSYEIRKASAAPGGGNAPVSACVPACAGGTCSCQFEEPDANAFYKVRTLWVP